MNSEYFSHAMTVIGHISFVLTFLSFAQKSLIRLRIIAVISQMFGLVYNGWINYHMPPGSDINLVVFWLAMFLVLNVVLLVKEISTTLEVSLPPETRELLVTSFPSIHSRDWITLMSIGKKIQYRKGDKVLSVGDATTSLQMIVEGTAEEDRKGVRKACKRGVLWGELTYVMGPDYYNSSPVDIYVTSEALTIIDWSYDELKKLADKNPRFNAALQNGFVHSAGLKHGLLADA